MKKLSEFESLQLHDLEKVIGGHNKLAYSLGRDVRKGFDVASTAFGILKHLI